ncbi:OmpH family outer membrane protein [Methylosarcina fibrata]|uniref:OmpH family outer membrane protein n=1 Tax=Methylosarcina fibrata TaxID=105972 RepID=UPI00036A82E1|nr:OmpH family outer membrane protein [Methylosarcina fibrata]
MTKEPSPQTISELLTLSKDFNNEEFSELFEKLKIKFDKFSQELKEEFAAKEKILIEDVNNQQLVLKAKETELRRMRKELIAREEQLQKQLQEREVIFVNRESELQRRVVEMERRSASYESTLNQIREHALNEKRDFEEKYKEALRELAEEKLRYHADIQQRIEGKSSAYVNDAIDALKKKENLFYWTSFGWSLLGGVSILVGLIMLLYSLHKGAQEIIGNKDIGWMLICFLAAKSLVGLGIIFALAKYSMMFSKAYMHEALRNIERQHAINFGKFYLGTYGAGATWESVKSVFEHWNITRDSSFLVSGIENSKSNTLMTSSTISAIKKGVENVVDIGKKIQEKDE